MKETQTYISAHQDRFLTELLEWLRIPSISADPAYAGSVRQAAEWMAENLKKAEVGDIVVITYTEAIAISVEKTTAE